MKGPLAGIFVGGAATRMGGLAKGLLRVPDGGETTLVERWRAILDELSVHVVLVGAHPAYAGLGIEIVPDEPAGIGPLGGLVALLRRAGDAPVLALACDMPFVRPSLVGRLLAVRAEAAIVAPRRGGRWEPLCARYDGPRVLPQALARAGGRDRSLQRLLEAAGAVELPLEADEDRELRDWDTPQDIR